MKHTETCRLVIKNAAEKAIIFGFAFQHVDKWNRKWGAGGSDFLILKMLKLTENLWVSVIKIREYNMDPWRWPANWDWDTETDNLWDGAGLTWGRRRSSSITFHRQEDRSAQLLTMNCGRFQYAPDVTARVYWTLLYDVRKITNWNCETVIDGEPIYEDHPINFNPDQNSHSTAEDVRRPLYWNLFGGHSDIHTDITQYGRWWSPWKNPVKPSAYAMVWGNYQPVPDRWFMAGCWWNRDPSLHVSRIIQSLFRINNILSARCWSIQVVATRDQDGTYAMVYTPVGKKIFVKWMQ